MLNPTHFQNGKITDRDLNLLARAEEVFRRRWADELGLDPHAVDLYQLPAAAPFSDLAHEAA